jgi:hypothetical protein
VVPQDFSLASAGALAAGLLVEACGSGDHLRVRTVRDADKDLGRGLSSLSEAGTPDSSVEAALVCADLATLAASNLPALPNGVWPGAVATTYLAAGTARALVTLAEGAFYAGDGVHAHNVLRDVRGAGWKADLAVRQLGGTG